MTQRLALITGASRGIGKAIAAQLVDEGLRVLATSRGESGKDAADEIGAAFHTLDVASDESIDALARDLERDEGGLDVLVNNAGVALDGFDAEVARRTVDVNFLGTMRVTDRLLPLLRPGARIVMLSSGMGELSVLGPPMRAQFAANDLDREALVALTDRFVADVAAGVHAKSGFPTSAYSVSKVAMNAYVRLLARELEGDPRGILVNAACPGWVRTAMGGPGAPRSPEEGARTPVWLALLPEGGPTGGFFRDEKPLHW